TSAEHGAGCREHSHASRCIAAADLLEAGHEVRPAPRGCRTHSRDHADANARAGGRAAEQAHARPDRVDLGAVALAGHAPRYEVLAVVREQVIAALAEHGFRTGYGLLHRETISIGGRSHDCPRREVRQRPETDHRTPLSSPLPDMKSITKPSP